MKIIIKLLLDFFWFAAPVWLGTTIKNISGGWILAKSYDPETNEVRQYRLARFYHGNEEKSIILWINRQR